MDRFAAYIDFGAQGRKVVSSDKAKVYTITKGFVKAIPELLCSAVAWRGYFAEFAMWIVAMQLMVMMKVMLWISPRLALAISTRAVDLYNRITGSALSSFAETVMAYIFRRDVYVAKMHKLMEKARYLKRIGRVDESWEFELRANKTHKKAMAAERYIANAHARPDNLIAPPLL